MNNNAIIPDAVNSTWPSAFNYDALSMENRSVIKSHTDAIKVRIQRTAQDIIDIGELLIDVKDRLLHGQFGLWLQVEFSWEERTAQRFISVAAMFKSDNLSDFSKPPLGKVSIDQSALYLLAAKSTPQEVRREVLERAYQGETITHAKIKQVVAKKKGKRSLTKRDRILPALAVGNWVRIKTLKGNKHWDGEIGQVVKPEEFGKFGVRLNETDARCLQFFPEELTIVKAPYRPGNIVVITCAASVPKEYRQHNGCWGFSSGHRRE